MGSYAAWLSSQLENTALEVAALRRERDMLMQFAKDRGFDPDSAQRVTLEPHPEYTSEDAEPVSGWIWKQDTIHAMFTEWTIVLPSGETRRFAEPRWRIRRE